MTHKPDPAHIETDKLLELMEAEINAIYRQASQEMQDKAEEYLQYYREVDVELTEAYTAGELSKQEYHNRKQSHILTAKWYQDMAKALADDMVHADLIAASIINGFLPEVYAINHNYGTYEIEYQAKINTNYTLYDRQTVERLMRDNPDLIPWEAMVKIPEAERWNKRIVDSVMTQSILQGEDIPTTASRIARELPTRNRNAAVRDARTMTTSAQNGGREDSFKRAEDMGIQLVRRWTSTLDGRTRHEHRLLDGQIKPVGEPFIVEGYEIMFPGDPQAKAFLVYNCRCTLIPVVKGMELPESFDGEFGYSRDDTLGDMSYEEWKADKGDSAFSKMAKNEKTDKKQYYEYRQLLGKDSLPSDFKAFQRLKYEKASGKGTI